MAIVSINKRYTETILPQNGVYKKVIIWDGGLML